MQSSTLKIHSRLFNYKLENPSKNMAYESSKYLLSTYKPVDFYRLIRNGILKYSNKWPETFTTFM